MLKTVSRMMVRTALLAMFAIAAHAEIGNGKYAIGFQSGFATGGIAGRIGLTDKISAEGIVGLFGPLTYFGARGLYILKAEKIWNAYAFGSVGVWSWDSGIATLEDETTFGVAGGAGIEYDWRAFNPDLPPITWNIELGLGLVSFDNYNFNVMSVGAGMRYMF